MDCSLPILELHCETRLDSDVAWSWVNKNVLTALPDETELQWMIFANRYREKKAHVSSVAAYEVPADVFSSNKATSGAANGINS